MAPVISDLDETMTDSQASQWVREKLPPGQGGRSNDRSPVPKNDAEMLTFLMTEVKDNQNITKTLGLIKPTVTYEQNVKNLTKAKIELRITFAYLMGMDPKNPEVTKWKVDGLRQAVMATLMRLMPKVCNDYNGQPYYMTLGSKFSIDISTEVYLLKLRDD